MKKFENILAVALLCPTVLINHNIQTSTIGPIESQESTSWWQKTAIGATILVGLYNVYGMYKKAFTKDIVIKKPEGQEFFRSPLKNNYGHRIDFNLYKNKESLEQEGNPEKNIIFFDYYDNKNYNVSRNPYLNYIGSISSLISGGYRPIRSILERYSLIKPFDLSLPKFFSKNEFDTLLNNLAKKMDFVNSFNLLKDFINGKNGTMGDAIKVSFIIINGSSIKTVKDKLSLLSSLNKISSKNRIFDEVNKDAVVKKLEGLSFDN